MNDARAKFTATIVKLGINPVVDPPDEVLANVFAQAGRSKGPVPVCGFINGAEYVQTLVRYRGKWRLYINGEMLKASGLDVGDTANIEIGYDPRPRNPPMPTTLAEALARNNAARIAFEKMTPSRQKEVLRYLGSLKTPESLGRNVEKVIKQLTGDRRRSPPAFMALTKK
jgi:hypothetical protein